MDPTPSLPPKSPVFVRGLLLEVGAVLDRLADALDRVVAGGSPPERMGEPDGGAPVFDFAVEVPWRFKASREYPVGRPAFGASPDSPAGELPPIDLSTFPMPPRKVYSEADAESKIRSHVEGIIRSGDGESIARWASLVSASHLTMQLVGDRPEWAGLPVDLDSQGNRFALRADLREWLDRHTPKLVEGSEEDKAAAAALRAKAVDVITLGFITGLGHSAPEGLPVGIGEPLVDLLDAEIPDIPKPVFRCGEKEGMAAVFFGPCVIDGEKEKAHFTIGASAIVFDGKNTVGRGPARDELPAVVSALRELAASYRPKDATIFGPRPSPPAREPRRPMRPSLLLDVRSRMDPETVKLATFAVQGTLPRSWRKARRWEEAEEQRVAEILAEYGEAAFEKTDSRPALLARRRGRAALSDRERNLLTVEIGSRGGFIRTDSEGEWLVRALRVGAGFVTVALSWYRSAEKLISDRREAQAKEYRAILDRAGPQRRLSFDDLSAEERGKIERVLEHIGTLEDARHLLDAVLRRAFATGAKVVDIPARELRQLLECDGPDGRGNERIRRGFAALEELSFKVVHKALKGSASGNFQGRFVAWHGFFAAGAGAHSDGVFIVELASVVPGVATILDATIRGKTSLGREAATAALESSAHSPATEKSIELLTGTTSDDEPRIRRRKKKGERPARALSSLGPWRKRALCETIFEERAFDFIESNLTTSLAPDVLGRPRRVRKAEATADGLRAYDREWCPLLPEGAWVGVLGTHRRSPETGWTLAGRGSLATKTGGGRPAGLIDQVGRSYPSGPAHAERKREALATLDDFAAVVGRLDGLLVGVKGRRGERSRPSSWDWISLEEARELPTKDLVAVRWYPFLPADWMRRADAVVERRQAERVARGESERPVFVTRSPADYLAAAEADGVRWKHRPGEVVELETWAADGRERAAPEVRPLGDRLAEKIDSSGMKKGDVAKAFGVSPASLSRWLRPLAARDEHKGSGVPAALAGLVERWIEGGPLPSETELEAVSSRHGKTRREPV